MHLHYGKTHGETMGRIPQMLLMTVADYTHQIKTNNHTIQFVFIPCTIC